MFASKAFPCTAVLAVFAEEGLWCDVASGGELHLALAAGFSPERIVMHGNAKSEVELRAALGARVGLIVVDNFDEIARLETLLGEAPRAAGERAGGAHPRDPRRPRGHAREDLDRPGRFQVRLHDGGGAGGDCAASGASRGFRYRECTLTSARSCSRSSRFAGRSPRSPGSATFPSGMSAAGWASATPADDPAPPSIEEYVGAIVSAAREHGIGPRSAAAHRARPLALRQRRRDALPGGERQAERLALGRRRRRHVRQPAPDALRSALRGPCRGQDGGRDRLRAHRQALRVGRCDRARRRCSTIRGRAT